MIALNFKSDALRNGMDPLSFLRYLKSLGEIIEIVTLTNALPTLDDFDPESCYLRFRIFFDSDADKATIEGVFEFAEDDCNITILPPDTKVAHYLELLENQPDQHVERVGEMLVQIGALTQKELERTPCVTTISQRNG